MLQQLGVMDYMLVQFPIPTAMSGPPAPVWSALQRTREDLRAGGRSGWRSCGIHVRRALTDWQTANPPNIEKGISDKTRLTRDQRLDRLREALRDFTHVAGYQENVRLPASGLGMTPSGR